MKKSEIKKLVDQLTLQEKAMLLSGKDAWSTAPIERLGIPSVSLSDGPHGLRKCASVGHIASIPATCFPTASLLACSWDEELAKKQGAAIGEEAQDQDLQVVLGPGNNIKRSPVCGRNFEYFSEDPYLSGHIAKGIIEGIQSKKVGTSLKHFAANNQEAERFTIDEKISERALREIYLASFEYPVKAAKPTTLMCSYNKINGVLSSENKWLLTDVLRNEWGFKGVVMSDWGAVANRPQGVYAGLDLEMPGSFGANEREIIAAANGEKVTVKPSDKSFRNKLTTRQIDRCVTRMLELVFNVYEKKNGKPCDYEKHHKIAAEIARECMVLLKNDGILPLKSKKIAVIGEMAVNPRYQGSGSSRVNAIHVSHPLDSLSSYAQTVYSQGYALDNDSDYSYIDAAVQAAKSCECAVIFAGLPDSYESEGYDRTHISIPKSHIALIEEVKKVQPNLVVVLCNGSPVAMPFLGKASAVLEAYLSGEAGAEAIADILFGKVNPCGKLAESFPLMLEQNPSYKHFGSENGQITYAEDIFVGYRWYESRKIPTLFPFGFGLSYTTFEYSNMKLSSENLDENDELKVALTVTNTGTMDGKEIVQLYVTENNPCVFRPEKELKGFKKIFLKAGESAEVTFTLDRRSFAYWDIQKHDWSVNAGVFTILAGPSSGNCPLKREVSVNSERDPLLLTIYSDYRLLREKPKGEKLARELAAMMGVDYDKTDNGTGSFTSLDWAQLKSFITMFGVKMTLKELVERLDEINS